MYTRDSLAYRLSLSVACKPIVFVCCPDVCDRYWAMEACDALRLLVPLGRHVEADRGSSQRAVVDGHGSPVVMHQSHCRPFTSIPADACALSHMFVSHYLIGVNMTYSWRCVHTLHSIVVVVLVWAYPVWCRMCTDRTGGSCQSSIQAPVTALPQDQARSGCLHTRRPFMSHRCTSTIGMFGYVYHAVTPGGQSPSHRV